MPPKATPAVPVASGAAGSKKGALAWLSAHPAAAAAIAGGGIGLVVLSRSRAKTTDAAGESGPPLGYVLPAGSGAGAAEEILAGAEAQIAHLAQLLQGAQPDPSLPTPTPAGSRAEQLRDLLGPGALTAAQEQKLTKWWQGLSPAVRKAVRTLNTSELYFLRHRTPREMQLFGAQPIPPKAG